MLNQDLIHRHTRLEHPAWLPALALHTAESPYALWEALEAGGPQLPAPFWAHIWPGGRMLSKHLLGAPELVRGRKVLDFATGGGVVALTARWLGASHVVAADVDALALEVLALNALASGLEVEGRLEDLIGLDEGWDTVLVGDVFYEKPLAERVMPWLEALARRGATVRIGDPGRQFLPEARLTLLGEDDGEANPAWDSVVDRKARLWAPSLA